MTQYGDELARLFRIASPPTESIEYAIGKAPFSIHAAQHDIPTPRTKIIENIDALHRAAEELTAPYVLKPNESSQNVSGTRFASGRA
jgi:predicted ATP-grasp superfamily ATP-dependent carboligase